LASGLAGIGLAKNEKKYNPDILQVVKPCGMSGFVSHMKHGISHLKPQGFVQRADLGTILVTSQCFTNEFLGK